MGQPEPIPLYYSPQLVADEPAPPHRPRRRVGSVTRRVRAILLIGALATAFISACVRGTRLDMQCRQSRDACTRLEAEIGELVVDESVLTEPSRVQQIALTKGFVALPAGDKVEVSPALLLQPSDPHQGEPANPPPQLAAWADLGTLNR
jgi:cell division protein FtsL